MPNESSPRFSQNYALFVAKEVLKEAAGSIFDDLRQTLKAHFANHTTPGCEEQAGAVMDLLSDVECRYYNTFDLPAVFHEVIER